MSAKIATWQARMSAQFGAVPPSYTEIRAICMQAEIDELRAALAAPAPIPSQRQQLVLDASCKQGKCARPTSGCWGKCGLESPPHVVFNCVSAAPAPKQAAGDALTEAEIIEVWDAQRQYHGGEPCKVGHVEFARAIVACVSGKS